MKHKLPSKHWAIALHMHVLKKYSTLADLMQDLPSIPNKHFRVLAPNGAWLSVAAVERI